MTPLFVHFFSDCFFCCWQVEWSPWASFDSRPGFDAARRISQVRRLLRHEYSYVFYIGEKVIRQYSPHSQLSAPTFPPSTMRRPNATPSRDRDALVEGIRYHFFLLDTPYDVFAAAYLLGEAPGISHSVIYDHYAALGGNPAYIWGQSYLLMHMAESVGPEPGLGAAAAQGAAPVQEGEPTQDVPREVRVDDPVEGMGDTQGQGVTVGVAEPMIPPEEPFISMSDLLRSRLAPPAGGIRIRESGSTGGSGVYPQFSLDARGKVPAVAGEGFSLILLLSFDR